MTGGQPGGANLVGELGQGIETKARVASHARIRGASGAILGDELIHDHPLEALPQIESDVWEPQRVAGGAGGTHRLRRAACALGVGRRGVDPEPQRHSHGVEARVAHLQKRDGAIHAARHGHRHPPGIEFCTAGRLHGLGDAGTESIDGHQQALAVGRRGAQLGLDHRHADRGGFERGPSFGERAQNRGRGGGMGAPEAAVPGGGDTAVHQLELDSHVISAGGVPGLAAGTGRLQRTRALDVQRVAYDSVGIHPRMVGE